MNASDDEIQATADALDRANADLANLLRATQIAAIFLDSDLRIRSFTPSASTIYGLNTTDIGRPLSQVVPPSDNIPPLPDLSPIDGSQPIEHSFQTRDGRWFVRRVSPYQTRDGETDGHVVTFNDITDRKEEQLALEDRERELRLLISSTAEGIYGIDLEGICTFANEASARLLGFETSHELIGQQLHELIHHTRRDGSPYPNRECQIYRAYRQADRIHVDDEVFWRQDGSCFDAEYWSYPQIRDGEVVGCVVTFLDISERKKWEKDLGDRESHLRRVIDNMLGFVGVLDTNGVLQEVNETAIRAGGLTRDDVIGKRFWECYWWSHDEDLVTQLKDAISRSLQGELVRYDVEVRMAGDSRLEIDFMLTPVKDAEGNVTHLIPSGVDVSERTRAEREVQTRVDQLDLALQSGRMGLWEWEIKRDHVTWSKQLYELLGYEQSQFEPTKAGFLAIVYPEDRRHVESLIQSAFASDCANHEVEFRVIRGSDGEIIWTYGRGTIRRDRHGVPESILSVAVDVTARKRRELALAFVADLQSSLAGVSSADEIVQVASQRIADHMNLSHVLFIEMDEQATKATVVGEHCRTDAASLIGQYDMAQFASTRERQRLAMGLPMVVNDTTASTRSAEYTANFEALNIGAIVNAPCTRDKTLAFMLSAVKPTAYEWHADEVDMMRELATILRLKLQRAYAEEQLKEARKIADAANESKSAFLANMSHEIRTPMTAILGYADLAYELVDNREAKQHLQTVKRNGKFLLDIINDILDLSKIEAGKLDINQERFAVNRLLEDVRSIMEVRASEKNLDLEVEYHGLIPAEIESDPKRLKQILINLVGNAIKFTERGNVRVVVRLLRNEGLLKFEVIDTGIGISKHQRAKLFQPFSQGDAKVSRIFGGTGLGLAISQRLATMLGGTISVHSEVDKGSKFAVTIQAGDLAGVDMIQPRETTEPLRTDQLTESIVLTCHVLVVDDRRDIRYLTRAILSAVGAKVSEAEDGYAAIEKMEDGREKGKTFDLILLDMQMPRLDGYETAVQLRARGYTAPIIALTADAMQGDMARCMECGCNSYLSKPIDAERLRNTVYEYTSGATDSI